jgi:glycosyltransferase involved in cell wall biosynthesis
VTMVRAILRGRAVMLAPNAEWMVPVLRAHFGDLAEVYPIPFGIHARWFSVERTPDSFSSGDWIMVSRVTKAKLGYLFEWGEGIFNQGRKLHLLGPMQENVALPDWVEFHGPTNPEALASDWFPRVAGLISLSAHDEGRPQVMIEAMAAGLPIIASDLPAHSELLVGGGAGMLVKGRESLASALSALEDSNVNCRAGMAARDWAAGSVGTWDESARLYVSAYYDLLERN